MLSLEGLSFEDRFALRIGTVPFIEMRLTDGRLLGGEGGPLSGTPGDAPAPLSPNLPRGSKSAEIICRASSCSLCDECSECNSLVIDSAESINRC